MEHPLLKELAGDLARYKRKRAEFDNIFMNYAHLARKMGWHRDAVNWLKRKHPDFPRPPCTRLAVENWIRRHQFSSGVPGRRPEDMVRNLRIYLLYRDGVKTSFIARLFDIREDRVREICKSIRRRLDSSESQIWCGPLLTAASMVNSTLNISDASRTFHKKRRLASLTSKPAI